MEQKIRLFNDIDVLSFNSEDDKLNIEGFAAHFGKPNLNKEIVFAESFDLFFEAYNNGQIRPILNFEHQFDKQIGGIDYISREKDGLFVRAHLNRSIPYVNDWIVPNIMSGDLNKFSSEGLVIGGRDGVRVNQDGSYVVLNFMMTAVAVVKHPADWTAEFTVKNYFESLGTPEDEVNKSKWYFI